VGAEVFATPGCESNVKEIYDKAKELVAERGDTIVNLNQFSEIGNPLWHYAITGPAMEEVYQSVRSEKSRLAALFLTQGSAGTLGCGDYLREVFPTIKVCAGEALQCPTLLYNGYGGHRIEGIGDKHVPWIFNVKNMDMVAGIDDDPNIRIMRLFNEPAGREYLAGKKGVASKIVEKLNLLGISSIANLMGSIKMAKYYEMTEKDVVFTVATDSMEMYQSRLLEETEKHGRFTPEDAAVSYEADLLGLGVDHMIELTYYDKRRMHNLKYFTWIEQQGKTVEELDAQWYDDEYWKREYGKVDQWDERIREFNERTGLLAKYL